MRRRHHSHPAPKGHPTTAQRFSAPNSRPKPTESWKDGPPRSHICLNVCGAKTGKGIARGAPFLAFFARSGVWTLRRRRTRNCSIAIGLAPRRPPDLARQKVGGFSVDDCDDRCSRVSEGNKSPARSIRAGLVIRPVVVGPGFSVNANRNRRRRAPAEVVLSAVSGGDGVGADRQARNSQVGNPETVEISRA